jgi:hypothetical protein
MAYSDFTLTRVKQDFQVKIEEVPQAFAPIARVEPSQLLKDLLAEYIPLAIAISTEKARSELLISQILTEVRRQLHYRISLFSGTEFNVDVEKGLSGYCDYLLSCSVEQLEINAPVVTIVEAKNENIKGGFGQCIAEMIAAQLFNQRNQSELSVIYGAVTTGMNWRFLKLEGKTVTIDTDEYYINEVDRILGITIHSIQLAMNAFNC